MSMRNVSQEPTLERRLALGIDELAAALGTSPGFVRAEIKRGRIQTVKRGRRVLIPVEAAREYAGGDCHDDAA